MSEIKTPVVKYKDRGEPPSDEDIIITDSHTAADIARWLEDEGILEDVCYYAEQKNNDEK